MRPRITSGPAPSQVRLSRAAGRRDVWRIDPIDDMSVPGVVFASESLLPLVARDEALKQVVNVARLPGVVEASYAMPDVHWWYGFPIGGVAATDVDGGGIVSPGGVGFDISCGVRLLLSPLSAEDLAPKLDTLMDALDSAIPRGLAGSGVWNLSDERDLDEVLQQGVRAAIRAGLATEDDLHRCEDDGVLAGADTSTLGERAVARGLRQVGSLGSGNHFLELQQVDEVYDTKTAESFGLHPSRVCVMIHSGSRGLGHQVCSDHVRKMIDAMPRYGIVLPDPQLACAPVRSNEGQEYLASMAAAANYGRANRQALSAAARRSFREAVGTADLELLYDVSHNLAKLEEHEVGGRLRLLCVHRKGATRALPPGHADLPEDLRPVGQPVLVPGSMGTASHVMVGVKPGGAFSSACHGAGRTMSRRAATRQVRGDELSRELERAGIAVRARSAKGLAEEAPVAYKDIDEVVATCERAGLGRRVARLTPIGVVKG